MALSHYMVATCSMLSLSLSHGMSTNAAKLVTGILTAASPLPIVYELHRDPGHNDCLLLKTVRDANHEVLFRECYHDGSHEYFQPHPFAAVGATALLLAGAAIAYRRSPQSIIKRAQHAIAYKNALQPSVKDIVAKHDALTMDQAIDQLSALHVQKDVPLASACEQLDSRFYTLLNAYDRLKNAQSKSYTASEMDTIMSLQTPLDHELQQLQTFMVALKKTPQYSTAMSLQTQIRHAQAARANARANNLNALANSFNAGANAARHK